MDKESIEIILWSLSITIYVSQLTYLFIELISGYSDSLKTKGQALILLIPLTGIYFVSAHMIKSFKKLDW